MAPTRCWATGAGPELDAQHADGGGAVPQLRHPRRCHGASGPGRSPRPAGPAAGVWAPAALGRVAGRALGTGTRLPSARERAAPQHGLPAVSRDPAVSRAAFPGLLMKWKVFLKRSKLSVLEAEVGEDLERVGCTVCAKRGRGPITRTWIGTCGGGAVHSERLWAPVAHPAVAGVGGAVAASSSLWRLVMREERTRVLYCFQWKNFVKKVSGNGNGEGKDAAPNRTFQEVLSALFAPGAVFLKLLSSSSKP